MKHGSAIFSNIARRVKSTSKTERVLVAFVLLYHVFVSAAYADAAPAPDEGTHGLVSLLYHDIFWSLPSFSSFSEVYEFATNYLVYYPKIQVTYPPLFHAFNGVVMFSLFGPSYLVSKLTSMLFSIAASLLLFALVKKLFNEKSAIVSVFLFFASHFVATYVGRSMIDLAGYFGLFLVLFAYFRMPQKKEMRHFVLLGAVTALAALGNRPVFFVTAFVALHAYISGAGKKNVAAYLLSSLLFISPYLLVLYKIGGFAINYHVVQVYGITGGEPALTQLANWYWYLQKGVANFPALLIPLALFGLHIKRRDPRWKELLILFLVFYVGMSIPQNKEVRMVMYIMLPALIAAGYPLN